jgi:hypothetical protein
MTKDAIHPITIKNLELALANKARQRNHELKKEFYSYEVESYEFIDINTFPTYKLFLFRCPKSKSTVSIKVNKEI